MLKSSMSSPPTPMRKVERSMVPKKASPPSAKTLNQRRLRKREGARGPVEAAEEKTVLDLEQVELIAGATAGLVAPKGHASEDDSVDEAVDDGGLRKPAQGKGRTRFGLGAGPSSSIANSEDVMLDPGVFEVLGSVPTEGHGGPLGAKGRARETRARRKAATLGR